MVAAVLVIIVFWVIFGIAGGSIDTEHPGRGFALGIFLGPIGLVLAAVLHSSEARLEPPARDPGASTRRCPYCAETIQAAAILCRFCGRDLPDLRVPVAVAASGTPAGWYPHPEYQGQECWWDGDAWTSKRRWQT
jgi:hypothetical protein